MNDPEIESQLAPLRAIVKEQGLCVTRLKQEMASEINIQQAVASLKQKKKILEEKELALAPQDDFNRSRMEDLLKQRFFYDQSFGIYGGVTGLYDFGPVGCAMKSNLLQAWRNFFILEDQMLEVDTAIVTPEYVLRASGHVERFQDFMVKDLNTGECFRADHLIEATFEKLLSSKKTLEDTKDQIRALIPTIDGMGSDEMAATIRRFDMKSPVTGNCLSDPLDFNLMFSTNIGPTGQLKGFLRPETAQGIFVNFKRLLEFNQGRLPFAGAQIGSVFRNEISPRSGLIRVREFTMAEIEHFCDPVDKSHPKFVDVADVNVVLYSACNQMDGMPPERLTIGEAVRTKLVANETLGYFIARIFLFLGNMGVDQKKLRFRQHLSNEMAHYASDCWDAECKTSYGWIECVGCADRSCYDLSQHMKATNVQLTAKRRLPEPKTIKQFECLPQKALIGKTFKADSGNIVDYLRSLDERAAIDLKQELDVNGTAEIEVNGVRFTIDSEMVAVRQQQKVVHVEEFVPSVIEPSFGIGRIMYAIFEHNFHVREGDEQRTYFSLPPVIAPYKCSVLPLSQRSEFAPLVKKLSNQLTHYDVSHKVDDTSGSIGRRYARTDSIAIPYGITVDFDSLTEPHSATLRQRDSMKQIRVPILELAGLVRDLVRDHHSWQDAMQRYPLFVQQESTK